MLTYGPQSVDVKSTEMWTLFVLFIHNTVDEHSEHNNVDILWIISSGSFISARYTEMWIFLCTFSPQNVLQYPQKCVDKC